MRWLGSDKNLKPVLLMGHMDVVEAKAEDWSSTDPFKMIEKDGYYYGRGTIDMKDGITAITQAMINLRKAGFRPKRDIVVLFTGDEETNGIGARNGASQWVDLLGHPEFGLNADGGGISFNTDGSPAGAGPHGRRLAEGMAGEDAGRPSCFAHGRPRTRPDARPEWLPEKSPSPLRRTRAESPGCGRKRRPPPPAIACPLLPAFDSAFHSLRRLPRR